MRPRGSAPVAPSPPPLPPPLGDAARDLVYRKLSRQAQHFPALLIDELSDDSPAARALDARDRAFAHAVYGAVIARWLTLEHLVQQALRQPLGDVEARLRAVLLAGAAQLILLQKVPAYAALNHGVQWAKERIRPGAGAMVNAVLRRVAQMRLDVTDAPAQPLGVARNELPLPDGRAVRLSADFLPEGELSRLSVATGVPAALLEAWSGRMPLHEVRRLALHTLTSPPVILNTAHIGTALSPEHSALLAPHGVPGHHVFTGAREELIALLGARQDLWVQDPASAGVLAMIGDLPLRAGLIIDACAGQGTKTRQLAALFPEATIIAADVDRRRHEALQRTFAGHARIRVVAAADLRREFLYRADLVLLDVPCSNSGVLARRPEAKYRFSEATLAQLVDLQRQIIADAIPLLREGTDGGPRGRLLYSTCSLEPRENEGQAEWAAHWHHFRIERTAQRAPAGGPGGAATAHTDGSYGVLLSW